MLHHKVISDIRIIFSSLLHTKSSPSAETVGSPWNDILNLFTTSPSLTVLRLSHLDYQRRQWHLTPVLLPGKSHGWRSLMGCSPWGLEESDTTERLHFHFSLSCTGEGNGNPLQCSCLENPRDRGAWWAAVYGVTQSQTQLTCLSSSSSSIIFVLVAKSCPTLRPHGL